MKATIKKAKEFSKEIVLIRAFAILMKDEHGQVIYTFDSKKKADEFYKVLTTNKEKKCRFGHECTSRCQNDIDCPCQNDHCCDMSEDTCGADDCEYCNPRSSRSKYIIK